MAPVLLCKGSPAPFRAWELVLGRQAAVRAEAQVQAEEVARRVAADPVHKEMALLEAMGAGRLRGCPMVGGFRFSFKCWLVNHGLLIMR
jgi:hypothetical protein